MGSSFKTGYTLVSGLTRTRFILNVYVLLILPHNTFVSPLMLIYRHRLYEKKKSYWLAVE